MIRPLISLLVALSAMPLFAEPSRAWISADGLHTLQGEYVSRDASHVTIRSEAGKEITVDLTKLHADELKWLEANHPFSPPVVKAEIKTAADPAAVFDTLTFKDNRETTLAKLKASKVVAMMGDETFLGRSGLNGAFHTRQKIGSLSASLYFDWTPGGILKEITLQTDPLPAEKYQSDIALGWKAFVELLSSLYGKPAQKGPLPSMASLADGSFSPSHLWNLESGGSALLGTARDGSRYQLVVRFTQKKVEPIGIF
jgi:hypothetical protein